MIESGHRGSQWAKLRAAQKVQAAAARRSFPSSRDSTREAEEKTPTERLLGSLGEVKKSRTQALCEDLCEAFRVDLSTGYGQTLSLIADVKEREDLRDKDYRDRQPIGPNNNMTKEVDITCCYAPLQLEEEKTDAIKLVLKLSVSLAATGMVTADIRREMMAIGQALGLQDRKIEVGIKDLQASFGGPVHLLNSPMSKALSEMRGP